MKTSRREIASLVAVAAVAASLLSAASAPPGPGIPAKSHVLEAPDGVSAVAAANTQGSPVEVADQRTSTRQVFANPGGTMTTELTAVPVRVKRGGAWVPIDTTLITRADGLVEPKAADGGVAFSGGGSAEALASLRRDDRTLSLYWPGELPTPELSGNAATYREVLPGVDLVMRAERNGLQQHLVVRNAGAARNPALAAIRMGMKADGLTVRADESGALHAVDGAGTEVFTAPPPTMWDSAGHLTRLAVSIVDGVLVLAPDQAFLADPATVYPVTVDPAFATFERNAWATVLSGKPGSSFWWTSGQPGVAQVGQCYNDGTCNGIGEAWAYFQFDTGFLRDKAVHAITLDTTVVYSPSCALRKNVLHGSFATINPSTNWINKPDGPRIAEFDAPESCGGWKGIGFNLGGNFNPAGLSAYSFRALDGNDQLAWRKYRPEDTKIRVTWNRAPNPPTDLTTDPPLRTPCKWCAGKSYIGDRNIRLIGRLSDPDNDAVDPQFEIDRVTADGVEEKETRGWGLGFIPSGQLHSTSVDLDADDGKTITWKLRTGDGSAETGEWRTAPRSFVVDRKGISATPAVASATYPEDNAWHGGVGVPASFTFSPGAVCDAGNTKGVCDIDHYVYGWQDPPTAHVDANALGGIAAVTIAPPGDGPRTLYVRSVDRANHHSPTKPHRFYVRAGNGPLAQWSLEGNANDTAFLGDRHGALNGNPTFDAGAVGTGLSLGGAAATEMTARNTVRTDASFSVSAWVRLNQLNQGAIAVEQRGNAQFGFALQYHVTLKKWVFVLPGKDAEPNTVWHSVTAPTEAVVNTWTHLAGTYDSASRVLTMYVNGNPVGTATRQTPWHAGGAVRVGRALDGRIDEVQLYDRVLGPAEVKAMVTRDNVQVGHWKFDDKDGTTGENSVEGGDSGVLEGGATFTDDGAVNRAVQLNGGTVTTGRPAVRTDQSFSVAAWVRADSFVTEKKAQTAVSQDGTRNSGFYLQYNNEIQKWVFLRFTTDDDTPGWIGVSASQRPATGVWTHLAGTFDAATRKMIIYVDGQYGGEGVLPVAPWDASGPLTIGRAKFAGNFVDHWPGAVDEVRMYSRVLSPSELEGIVSRNDVPAGLWKLDGVATDESGNHRNSALQGNPAWTSGQALYPDPADLAVSLDGVDDHVSAATVVNTTQSYSVSTWVRLGQKDPAKFYSAVSQSGTQTQAFTLGYNGGDDRWAFQINGNNAEPPTKFAKVSSATAAQTGVWTHLAAVYQSSTGEMRLYVNGVLSNTKTYTGGSFIAQTEFTIGRTKFGGKAANFFNGGIDDVKVYSRPLFADEVRVMAGRDMSLVHNWPLDEGVGNGTSDAVGGRTGTLANGATFGPGRAGNAVRLDGVNDMVSTTGVDVSTERSFTVTAWVNLDTPAACPGTCRSTAVSVDGGQTSNASKFRLGHRIDRNQASGDGKWIFEMPERDGSITEAAISVKPAQFNSWVYLVGVYDQPAGQIWLYVYSGTKAPDVDSGTLMQPWQSGAGLRLGASQRAGAAADPWRGSVDDVRLYTGDLDPDRLDALFRSYPASAPSASMPVADKGHWKFDENTGTTAKDSSGRELTATLRDGAGWQGGRIGNTNSFDGTSGFAETAAPVLDTSESFSVSAWAYLSTGGGTGHRTVLGQDAGTVSAFLLQYQPEDKRWAIVLPSKDEPNPTSVRLVSTGPPMLSPWTHLVIAYDAESHQVRLYVNGMLSVIRVGVSILDSAGPLSIGRGKWNLKNAEYFPGSVDDVRAFGKALSEGEVRRIHDDAPGIGHGYWGFEGNVNDTSWRQNPTTPSRTGISYVAGLRGQAMKLDGAAGAANTQLMGANMLDTFTVSGWAKLSGTEHDATVVSQDGTRMSGFLLQYNKDIGRWIFGAAAQDADNAQLVYAYSPQAPAVDVWTHLAGVYDYPARQLRLYVNGALVHIKNDAPLWPTANGLAIGRAKKNGTPSGFFSGALDELRVDYWAVSDEEIAQRAGYPAPAGGQLGRFVNAAGERHSINSTGSHEAPFGTVAAGYRFDGPLGQLLTTEQPGTRKLYACKSGTDEHTSTDGSCSGATKLGELGWAYVTPPAHVPTTALYGCTMDTGRFDSLDVNCEGKTKVETLGYTVAYAALSRYQYRADWEDSSTVYGAKPGYRWTETLGLLAMVQVSGTQRLWSCREGIDEFATTDPACAGKTVVTSLGWLWTEPPPGAVGRQLFLCQTTAGDRFNSYADDCNGATRLAALGYVLAAAPEVT